MLLQAGGGDLWRMERTHTVPPQSGAPAIPQVVGLAVAQILLWGGSYFLLSVLSKPIIQETGWAYQTVYGCLSVALLVAGLILPKVGRTIHTAAYNYVLCYAGIVMAAGLVVIGLANNFPLFVAGWLIIGIAMGMGLYDALFASLGKQYGIHAKKAIVWVTLLASLAPSLTWNGTKALIDQFGWRHTCFIYAAILVVVIYPIHRYVLRETATDHNPAIKTQHPPASSQLFHSKIYYLLLAHFTLGALITTGMVVHLIDVLSQKKMPMPAVLTAVAFLGPSQAAARTMEWFLGKRTAIEMSYIAAGAMLTGIALFLLTPQWAIAGVVLFGLGNGMRSVLRGTLPLAVFGMENYAVIIGRLARMPLIAQAAAPFIGGFIIQQSGTSAFIVVLCALALINIVFVRIIQQTIKQS